MTAISSSPLQHINETRRHYGLSAAASWASSRFFEKALQIEVNKMLWLDLTALPPFIDCDPEFSFRFLSTAEIASFSHDSGNEIAPEFLQRALSKQNQCLAAFHGEKLAAYSWYARNSVDGKDHLGVSMSFPTDVVYMYNAFTHPDFRGRRLFNVGVALAAKEFAAQGATKMIASVNSTNFASLRSCKRLGFRELGRIWTLGSGDQRLARTPFAAKRLGIHFGDATTSLRQ
jgi:ribosomal protein S18 acetylase RimI-like enzyme